MSSDRRTAVDHAQTEATQRDQRRASEAIGEAIERCSKALGRGGAKRYAYVATTLRDELLPALRSHASRPLHAYNSRLEDTAHWDWVALRRFDNNADALVGYFTKAAQTDGQDLARLRAGRELSGVTAKRCLRGALESVTAIAETEGVVNEDYARRVDAEGHRVKIGEHLQDGAMDIGDPVGAVSLQAGSLKTLFCGGTGFGKSCGLEREAEDFYQQTHAEGRDYKVIDLVDLDTGENWVYDIPQQQEPLRRIREDMGLPADFTESDDLGRPDVEILLPLTPGLAGEDLPYNTADGAFTTQPFVIPASDIRKPILLPAIMSRVSDDQEQTIRQAYDDMSGDWSLKDLADEIRTRDELSPKHKSDAIGVLRSLQGEGFIRTRSHPDTLDWRELFRDTETITLFSQAKVDSDIGTMLCLAYLIDKMLDVRKSMFNLPDAVLLMRELWEVVPHGRRDSSDERAAAVQEAIGYVMAKVFRKLRHFGMHVIADTQEPGDLHKATRELFNRYVVYTANMTTVDNIFSWTQNDRKHSFASTLTAKKGQAGVVGQVEPAINNRDIEFLSPIEYAPPSHHHFDKNNDSNGWHIRAKYLDDEELRRPLDVDGVEWDDELPQHLQIATTANQGGPQPDRRPVAAFADACLQTAGDDTWVHKEVVRQTFNEFLKKHDREPWDFDQHSKVTTFSERLRDYIGSDEYQGVTRQGEQAFLGLEFSADGSTLRGNVVTEAQHAAEPIQEDD